jgi:hypothetical protein
MRKKILINLLIICIIISTLFLTGFVASSAYAQNSIVDISSSPSTGTVGSTITISGSNFPGTRANIYWDEASIARDIPISTDGTFSYKLTVPASSKGAHIISADDNSNWAGGKAETKFNTVPSIDIFPKIAEIQTPILIRGNGFGSNETNISIMVDGKVIPTHQITTDLKGYWSASYTVHDLENGKHTISASSSSTQSTEVNSAIFILAPWLEVSPTSGAVGTQLMIYGWGFRHNEDGITVTWDGEIIKVNIRAEVDGSLIVDGTKREYGNFTSDDEYHDVVYVPKTTQGKHVIGVYGSSFTPRGTLPYYDFDVIPQITVDPPSGHKGTQVTIDGTGFAANESVSLKFDNTDIGEPVTADNTGSFNTIYKVSQGSSSQYTISANGSSGNTASTDFSIDVVDVAAPTLESPANKESTALFDSVGDVYISSFKYLFGLGNYLSGKSNVDDNDVLAYFKWNLSNALVNTQYILQISRDSNFNDIVIEKTLSNNVFNLTRYDGISPGTYYWRVKASNSSTSEGDWSQTYTFEVVSMPILAKVLSIVVLVLIIAAIVFIIILLWNNSVNKYKY